VDCIAHVACQVHGQQCPVSRQVVAETCGRCHIEIYAKYKTSIHGVAIAKGASMDYTMQKATELGATCITPLVSERSTVRLAGERSERKLTHWREVCASSCEQCGRHYLPMIAAARPLLDWSAEERGGLKLMLHPDGQHSLPELPSHPTAVTIATGPEGGFTEWEVERARAAGFRLIRVGPRTLRAETAPVVALSLVQYLWGDLGHL